MTCAQVRSFAHTMVFSHRVYLVMTPQTHLTIAADDDSPTRDGSLSGGGMDLQLTCQAVLSATLSVTYGQGRGRSPVLVHSARPKLRAVQQFPENLPHKKLVLAGGWSSLPQLIATELVAGSICAVATVVGSGAKR